MYHIAFYSNNALLLYLNGYSVILGHVYPFFMNFKGGKGTAALIGVLIGLDLKLGLIGMGIILLVTFISDYVAIGTLALTLYFIGFTIFFEMGWIPISLRIKSLSLPNVCWLITIFPASFSKRVLKILIVVDLPAPLGPRKAKSSPSYTFNEMFLTACNFP